MKNENGWVRAGLVTLTIARLGGGAGWWYRSTQTNATGADKSGATSDAKGGAAGAGGRGRTVLDVGELLAVDNQIDAATGTVKLKAVFPSKNNTLFPNQFVTMKLKLERLDAAITILQSAVQRGTPGTYVYVVTAEKNASLRKVQLGPVIGDRVVIAAGLKEGESIVIDGADNLRPRPHSAARVVIVQKRTALHRATVKHPQRQALRPLPRLPRLRQARAAPQRHQPRKTANQNR